jgi:hypothetical protein
MMLLGYDVGWSRGRRTTGIARYERGRIDVWATGSDWTECWSRIGNTCLYDMIAIDGPIPAQDVRARRFCEYVFVRGAFHKRCKPGLSESGQGFELRLHAIEAADELSRVAGRANESLRSQEIRAGKAIVEAFPNGFLGVLLDDQVFECMPKLKRGRKFDWLYEEALRSVALDRIIDAAELGNQFSRCVHNEKGHETRAALICVLTAALAFKGRAEAVGDPRGGWFWLPPYSSWATWAQTALPSAIDAAKQRLVIP